MHVFFKLYVYFYTLKYSLVFAATKVQVKMIGFRIGSPSTENATNAKFFLFSFILKVFKGQCESVCAVPHPVFTY